MNLRNGARPSPLAPWETRRYTNSLTVTGRFSGGYFPVAPRRIHRIPEGAPMSVDPR